MHNSLSRGRRGAEEASDGEARATQAFIRVLQDLFSRKASCTRLEWNSHRPPTGAFMAAQERTFIGIISEILENEAAVRGMLATFRADLDAVGGGGAAAANVSKAAADGSVGLKEAHFEGSLAEFDTMMRRLFTVLDANRSGVLEVRELRALTQALTMGSEGLGRDEQAATKAFIGAIEGKLSGVAACTLELWMSIAPLDDSFSRPQAFEMVRILTEILDDDAAVEGLLKHCLGGR